MYAKPKPVAWALASWMGFLALLLGGAYVMATFPSSAVGFKNTLLRWGLATLDAGDGFLTFGEGTQVHITITSLFAWILLAAVPAALVYAIMATRKSQVEVDMQAAVNPNVQPEAPVEQPQMQQPMMGYPQGMAPGYPGMLPQQQVPQNMVGGIPHNPGGG